MRRIFFVTTSNFRNARQLKCHILDGSGETAGSKFVFASAKPQKQNISSSDIINLKCAPKFPAAAWHFGVQVCSRSSAGSRTTLSGGALVVGKHWHAEIKSGAAAFEIRLLLPTDKHTKFPFLQPCTYRLPAMLPYKSCFKALIFVVLLF
jgi:hypothetical protein